MILADLARRAHTARRSSGTATRPTFASRVENAYFVVSAACVAVSALNKADLPTFGRPTMPQLKPMIFRMPNVAAGRPDQSGGRPSRLLFMLGRCGVQSANKLGARPSPAALAFRSAHQRRGRAG